MPIIKLTQGKVALIDDDVFDEIAAHKWHAMKCGTKRRELFYAVRNRKRPDGKWDLEMMHRRIMRPEGKLVVDHLNHDGLDNRRVNLRVCTQGENMKNLRSGPNKTGFRGVCRMSLNRFGASIRVNGRVVYLGCFEHAEDAARAYDRVAIKHFGALAHPNFPELRPNGQEQAAS